MTGEQISPELRQLARGLKALLLDVDGVLTDGGIIILGDGGEAKRFDVQDGMGVNIARAAGLKVARSAPRTIVCSCLSSPASARAPPSIDRKSVV